MLMEKYNKSREPFSYEFSDNATTDLEYLNADIPVEALKVCSIFSRRFGCALDLKYGRKDMHGRPQDEETIMKDDDDDNLDYKNEL